MQHTKDSQEKAVINGKPFESTRHRDAEPDTFDPNVPRLGRRESEPHSIEISYLYDVLTKNFPEDRTTWDLHHYFRKERKDIDIQFDISFFRGLSIPYTLSAYHANQFNERIPNMAINILSKSTWRSDLAEKVDICRLLEVPLYVVFPTYQVAIELYNPPFLRAYVLQSDGAYKIFEVQKVALRPGGELNLEALIDVSHIVPFRLGLCERDQKHQDDEPLYRLALFEPEKNQLLLTTQEKKDIIIREQNQKIGEQNQKIGEQNRKISEQNQKIKDLEAEIKKLKLS